VLGLMVGSFLNVVIYRLPLMLERQWREECAENAPPGAALEGSTSSGVEQAACVAEMTSADGATGLPATAPAAAAKVRPEPFNLVVPRSACPACRTPIRAIHNV